MVNILITPEHTVVHSGGKQYDVRPDNILVMVPCEDGSGDRRPVLLEDLLLAWKAYSSTE